MIVTTASGTKYLVNDMKLTRVSERPPDVWNQNDRWKAQVPIIACPILFMTEPTIGSAWVLEIHSNELEETTSLRTNAVTNIDYEEEKQCKTTMPDHSR